MDERLAAPSVLAALSEADRMITLGGGATIAFKRWGRGPPVLCLHAVGHGGGDFADLAARLGEDFQLIAPDWPGMGRSPPNDRPVRADAFAQIALELIYALELRKPIVIGNSIGGAAAMIAAARATERLAALVLCNPGGRAPLDGAAKLVIGRMAAFFRAGARGARWFPPAFALYYRTLLLTGAAASPQRRRISAAGRELAPLLANAWTGFGEPAGDLRELAAGLRTPVWLAWARGDAFVSWSRAKAAAAATPDHRVTLFSGGHSAFLEDPAAFTAAFRAFAADIAARASRQRAS